MDLLLPDNDFNLGEHVRAILLLAALSLFGTATTQSAGGTGHSAPQAAPGPHIRALSDLARAHSMLLIGELHGTVETPQLVEQVVLSIANESPVILALEWPAAEQPRVDAYLTGNMDARTLASSPFWSAHRRDGRSSRAMFDLLTSLRTARTSGSRIEVVCFDGPPAIGSPDDREAGLAEHLRNTFAHADGVPMLVLSGNYHARLTKGTAWSPDKPLMGYLLRDLHPFNVDVRAVRGGAWVCLGDGGCGVHEFDLGAGGVQAGWSRRDEPDRAGYLATLVLTQVTPSPPHVPETGGEEKGEGGN